MWQPVHVRDLDGAVLLTMLGRSPDAGAVQAVDEVDPREYASQQAETAPLKGGGDAHCPERGVLCSS